MDISEHYCKKKYRPQKHIPVIRIFLIAGLVVAFLGSGFAQRIVDRFFGNSTVASVEGWKEKCRMYGGVPGEVDSLLARCSFVIRDSLPILPNPILRYVAEGLSIGTKVFWVAPVDDFSNPLQIQVQDSTLHVFLHVHGKDSSAYWIDYLTRCRYPGACPVRPLDFSSVEITESFDFEGNESVLAKDILLGIGEAPIHPILPGVVLQYGKDSLGFFVELYHGDNIVSLMSGMNVAYPGDSIPFLVGDSLGIHDVVGRLAPMDSARFFLSVRKNGSFVRWEDFYRNAHPLDSTEIAKFVKDNRL